ncbi:MAG TPA: hypothetical protein VNQ77_01320 [Frankiaceae bacterium]|nr:hypothetical protein [Frankiaceae bacterium]
MVTGRAVCLLLLALAAGCAEPGASVRGSATTPPASTATATAASQRYEITALVRQAGGHRPQLCVGSVADSRPPRCGGPEVVPFDWADVPGEESAAGVTWGEYRLVGTYDGSSFHLTEPPAAPAPRSAEPDPAFPTACPAPAGGWRVTDPERRSDTDWTATARYARGQRDFAGLWLSWPDGRPREGAVDGPQEAYAVVNVAFTGGLDRHRREIAERWGGALCVTSLPRTHRELHAIEDDAFAHRDEAATAGVELVGGSVDEVRNVVELGVLVVDDAARRWFGSRYGDAVELYGVLRPV